MHKYKIIYLAFKIKTLKLLQFQIIQQNACLEEFRTNKCLTFGSEVNFVDIEPNSALLWSKIGKNLTLNKLNNMFKMNSNSYSILYYISFLFLSYLTQIVKIMEEIKKIRSKNTF